MLTDTTNRDPYARTFRYPKWTRVVRVTDEPRLFARLPEFAGWTKDRHYRAALEYLACARVTRAMYHATVARAIHHFGDGSGVLISGVYREHFPEPIKVSLRVLAREASDHQNKSLAHWRASGRRLETWRRMRGAADVEE